MKDGGDGLGDVAIHKEKGLRYLPDKALRFSFCVLECPVEYEGDWKTVYMEPVPNSVKTNSPLLEALCDENSKSSVYVCLQPIEAEREALHGKVLKVNIGAMLDEKYDIAFGSLQASGSLYMCTLCDATSATAKENLGTFDICAVSTLST